MRNFSKHIILFLISALVWTGTTIWAQPATVSPEGGTALQQHGNNSSGNPAGSESIDSLTQGAANVKYFVYPDLTISPSYNVSSSYTANLNSTFSWAPIAGATIDNAIAGFASNYAKITFPNTTGDRTVSVTETASGCTSAANSFTARLIAPPDITAVSVSNITCQTTPISVTCPNAILSATFSELGLPGLRVEYNLTGPTGSIAAGVIVNIPNTIPYTLNLSAYTLTNPGTYTLTIVRVTDRIGIKSGFTNSNAFADGTSTTFYVTPTPVTSPTMHVPNDGW